MARGTLACCATVALALGTRAEPVIPRVAPSCALMSIGTSERFDLERFRGNVLWVDFWASWCGPCAEAFPFLDDLERELGARGLRVVAINVDENVDDAREFVSRHPVAVALASDPSGTCARAFGVPAMPAAYLVDRRGAIRHVHTGFRAGEAEALRGVVRALLAEEQGDDRD